MSDSSYANLVVRRVDPRRRRQTWAMIAAAIAVAAILAFWAGYRAGDRAAPDRQRYRDLMTELQASYRDNARMRERVAALERSEQVARNANRELRGQIESLQASLASVRSDLTLYQGLASAAGSVEGGLGVHQLVLSPAGAPRVYEYTLTLMQNLEQARPVEARVWLAVDGTAGGEPRRLGLSELRAGGDEGIPVAFKYFRLMDGTITLPPDFRPGRVHVRLSADGNGQDETVEADFDWSAVVKRTARAITN